MDTHTSGPGWRAAPFLTASPSWCRAVSHELWSGLGWCSRPLALALGTHAVRGKWKEGIFYQ